jgi:hypothetical protein
MSLSGRLLCAGVQFSLGLALTAAGLNSLWNQHLTATIEDRFRDWAFGLVTHERWHRALRKLNEGPFHEDSHWREAQLLTLVREFAGDYTSLLERAVIEFVRELSAVIQRQKLTLSANGRQELMDGAFRFVQRFTMGVYKHPWEGFFMLPPADSREMPDERTLNVDFQRANFLARLFQEAQDNFSLDAVDAMFLQETEVGKWKDRARRKASNELLLATFEVQGNKPSKAARVAQLRPRENRIWEVIQGGAKGLHYCRELKNLHLRPPTSWVKDGCPSDYPAAYVQGEPWRHRIQDEKTKVRRKATRKKLA